MAGRGRTPKDPAERVGTEVPLRGEWSTAPGIGWQYGAIPKPPAVGEAARAVWEVWFRSWFAANWTPESLPQIEHAIMLLDQCRQAFASPYLKHVTDQGTTYTLRPNPTAELRQWMDGIGASFKGQQDRRWKAPEAGAAAAATPGGRGRDLYGHLAVVVNE